MIRLPVHNTAISFRIVRSGFYFWPAFRYATSPPASNNL